MMVQSNVKEYLERELLITFGEDNISADTNLLEDGIMDSFSYVQLINFIEAEFQITFSDEEMIKSPLYSLSSICSVIEKKCESYD